MRFTVKTHDVDGRTSKTYRSRAGAFKRFEEMLGYTVEAAIAEQFFDTAEDKRPTRDTVKRLRAVSMYGTVVSFEATEDAATEDATEQPNAEQLARLQSFAAEHGRCWKSELLSMWVNGRDASQRDGHLLRQVRNTFGPSWLQRFTLPSA